MEASPAPGGASTPLAVAATSSTAAPSVARNSMANPSGVGAGAPVRNFLNQNVAGYVKRAMLGVWEARPQHPLTWVGEYLISCDIKYNSAPSEESQRHFLYHKNGIDHLLQQHTATAAATDVMTEASAAPVAPSTSAADVPAEPSSTSTPSAFPVDSEATVPASSEIKAAEQGTAPNDNQEAVNGTKGGDSDEEMKDS